MLILVNALSLIFLVLFQTTFLSINAAFVSLFAASLYFEEVKIVGWLAYLSVIFSLFSNLNLGLVLLGFVLCFIFLQFLKDLLPDNNITKVSLIVLAIPVVEVSLRFLS